MVVNLSDFYEFMNLNIALIFLSSLSQQKSLLCRLVATNFYKTNSPCLTMMRCRSWLVGSRAPWALGSLASRVPTQRYRMGDNFLIFFRQLLGEKQNKGLWGPNYTCIIPEDLLKNVPTTFDFIMLGLPSAATPLSLPPS